MAKQQQRRPQPPQQNRPPVRPAAPQRPAAQPRRTEKKSGNVFTTGDRELLYGRQHFIIFGIGLGLVLLGLALMAGGAMPDPMKWEPERIYSFRRITLAPICMVAGFVTVIYGIFKRNAPAGEGLSTSVPLEDQVIEKIEA